MGVTVVTMAAVAMACGGNNRFVGGVGVGWGSVSVGSMTVGVSLAVPVRGGWLIIADGSLGYSWGVSVGTISTVVVLGVLGVRHSGLGDSRGSIGVTVAVTVAAVACSRRVLLGGSLTIAGSRSVLVPGVGAGDSHSASGEILH